MRRACAGSGSGHTSANPATRRVCGRRAKGRAGARVNACACTKSSVCIGVGMRKVECKQETEASRGRESARRTDLKIDLWGKSLLCSIPGSVCARMGMQQCVRDIKTKAVK